MASLCAAIHNAIKPTCPTLCGVSEDGKGGYALQFSAGATEAQKAAALTAYHALDLAALKTAKPPPTVEERLAKLENDLAALKAEKG